eukprot:CAMPEP_0171983868 /NCGR_PEP_ID=MMETSP0993-20121228/273532_1 /TAXON_ID=483369 /ORGANISM="non described non described, Strain CCMP2098" /LENGTH=305 /DNA_ID=CAMNT_0012636667 /DNA_START=314 /DNA_END=1229 /DNA_ORIENTATION=+
MGEKPDDTVTPATWAPPQGTSALGVASVAVTPQVGGRPESSGLSLSPIFYGRVPTFPARLRLTDNGATRSEEGQLACHIVRSRRAPRHKCTMGEKPDDAVTPATWAPPQGTSALGVASVAVTSRAGGGPESSGLSLSPIFYGRVPTLQDNGATRSEEGQLTCHIVRSRRAPRHKCTMGEKPNDAVTPATWAPPQGTSALGVASVAVTSRAGGGPESSGLSLSPIFYGRVPTLSCATAAATTAAAAAAAVPIVRTVLKPWVLLEHYSNDGGIRQSRNPRRCHYHLMPDPRHCARRKRDENAHYTSL